MDRTDKIFKALFVATFVAVVMTAILVSAGSATWLVAIPIFSGSLTGEALWEFIFRPLLIVD